MAQKKKIAAAVKPAAKSGARKAPAAKVSAAPAKTAKSTTAKTKAAGKPVTAAAKATPAAKPKVSVQAAKKSEITSKKPTAVAVAKEAIKPAKAGLKKLLAETKQAAAPRAVAAAVQKPVQKLTAPVGQTAQTAKPKAIAAKAAASRQMLAAQKKPVNQRHGFKANEFVVYPAHGVGRIVGIEEQEIAGMSLELFVITFDKEKLTLRVPTGKLESVGMRKLADDSIVKKAMDTLKGRARIKRTMWSRRAQEYVAKINSGDLISIAEVVRDLYRSEAQPEQSYSERQLYEDALDRMARELAAVEKLDERGAMQRITDVLSKSAKSRNAVAAEGEAVGEAA